MIITNHPCCTVIRPGHVSQPYPTEQNMFANIIIEWYITFDKQLYVKISLELLHNWSKFKVLISLTSISDDCKNTNVE